MPVMDRRLFEVRRWTALFALEGLRDCRPRMISMETFDRHLSVNRDAILKCAFFQNALNSQAGDEVFGVNAEVLGVNANARSVEALVKFLESGKIYYCVPFGTSVDVELSVQLFEQITLGLHVGQLDFARAALKWLPSFHIPDNAHYRLHRRVAEVSRSR